MKILYKETFKKTYVVNEIEISKNDKGEEVFNFGKHKGKKVSQVFESEPSYYNWILDGEFSGYTKKNSSTDKT